jgi:Domain of unknown function (DUF6265)
MHMRKLIAVLLFAFPVFAGEPRVEDVAWMTGHWAITVDGNYSEEVWLAPRGGMMSGMNRGVTKSGRTTFEFMRVQTTNDGVFYMAQPGGRPPTSFKLIEASAARAVFSNPQHDFPQRVIYTLRDGKLCGRVEGTMNGKAESEEWCWERVAG